MKKFVATALTVVAPSVDKSSKVSDSKKRSAKEDVESDILVKSPQPSPTNRNPSKIFARKVPLGIQKSSSSVMSEVKVYRPLKFVYPVKFYLPPTCQFFILPSTQFYVSCKVLPLESPIFQHLTQKKWLKNCIFYRVFGKIFYLHNFTECSVQFSCF